MMIVLLLTATSLSAADSPAAAEHLLYLAEQGLAVVRLRIEIDGQSPRELAAAQISTLCQRADRDHDGYLTAEEFEQGIANHPAIQEAQARVMTRPRMTAEKPDFATERLPLEAIESYVVRRLWPPLRVEHAGQRMSRINAEGELAERPLADTQLFERLDTDGNRQLTGRELDRAATVLAKVDFDEDDVISLEELRIQTTPAAPRAGNAAAGRADANLMLLAPDRIDAAFVRRILDRYDDQATGKKSGKDLRLDPAEIRLPPALFTQADADENGVWDFEELWRFLERPVPSAEILLRLSMDTSAVTKTFSAADAESLRLIHEQSHALQFDIHGTRFQLQLPAGATEADDGPLLAAQFQTLDVDQNEYLEAGELNPAGADEEANRAAFRQMDPDGDEKVFLHEFTAYSRKSLTLRQTQWSLAVENLGRTLFGPLDVNGDGRLSQRELAQLKVRLPDWDVDGDGKLVEAEIPQQYRLTLTRGGSGPTGSRVTLTATSSAGPLWFRKMDRNRDGEVSAKEFLGTTAQFEKIDANGDGAIDVEEAAAVK